MFGEDKVDRISALCLLRRRSCHRFCLGLYVNQKWVVNYPVALRFYNAIRDVTVGSMTVVGLIDDGMFEEHIQVSAALLGETLWNPKRDAKAVLEAARNPYYGMVE